MVAALSTDALPEERPWLRVRQRTNRLLAGTGAILSMSGIGWLLLVAGATGGDGRPASLMLALIAASCVAARWLTRYNAWIASGLLAAGAATLAVLRFDVLLERPLGDPLGYSNATGSFYMLAAAAAFMIVARVRHPTARGVAALAAVAFASVPWLNGTTTAAILVCVVPVALLARSFRATRFMVAGSAAVVLLSVLVVFSLGASYRGGDRSGLIDRVVGATLGERRLMLWNDAVVLVARHPLTGVGPNRFPEESATARANRDTPWPHSEALHFGAEAGVPGFLLVLALFTWGFARLWWGAGDPGGAVSAVALGAVGIHANVDYVLHYPGVAIAAGMLVGVGSRLPRRRYPPR